MTNTNAIKDALKQGTEARLICMTCPWDRLCLTPPSMTAGDIDREIKTATTKATESNEKNDGLMASIFSTLIFAGKDTTGELCPVFVNRLHSSDGRKVADTLREMMQGWAD
jgi:hypothetical protein